MIYNNNDRPYPRLEVERCPDLENCVQISIKRGSRLIAARPFDYAEKTWKRNGTTHGRTKPYLKKGEWEEIVAEFNFEYAMRALMYEDLSFSFDDEHQKYDEDLVLKQLNFVLSWAGTPMPPFSALPSEATTRTGVQRLLSIAAACDVFDQHIAENPTADFMVVYRGYDGEFGYEIVTFYSESLEDANWKLYDLLERAVVSSMQFGMCSEMFAARYITDKGHFEQMALVRLKEDGAYTDALINGDAKEYEQAMRETLCYAANRMPYPYLIDEAKRALMETYDLAPIGCTHAICANAEALAAPAATPATDASAATASACAQAKNVEYAATTL